MSEDDQVPTWLRRYPPAEISAREFEDFVAKLFASLPTAIQELEVKVRNRLEGSNGTYELDATVQYKLGGLEFLIVVEAKRQSEPVKRQHVQVLYQKVQSLGAQKGVLFSTSPFQRGALKFATVHGIALVSVTEGRFTIETKTAEAPPTLSRKDAAELFGIPTFVGHAYRAAEDGNSATVTRISPENPEYIKEHLLPQ